MTPRTANTLLAASLAALFPVAAQAQDENWQSTLTIYGWFPAISGTTSYSYADASIDVSSGQVIDSLKMAFMGAYGAKKGKWGVWTDLTYSDLSGSKQNSRDFTVGHHALPASANADLSLGTRTLLWTVAGTYELAKTTEYTADFLLGARLLDVQQTLDVSLNGDIAGLPLPGRNFSSTVDESIWNGIIGIKGLINVGDNYKWFVPYHLDIGTGQSNSTWQANLGIGYRYKWGAVVASWRYLDYNMKTGDAIQNLSFSGPLVGAAWQW